jgi:hypothetical protein
LFSTDTVASTVCQAATSSFVASGSSDGGYLGDPIVNPHEVGIFSELGDDLAHADPLGLLFYRGDRHEALLRSGVYPVGNLIESLVEVSDRESLLEMSTLFVLLSVAATSSVLVVGGLIRWCNG